MITITRRLSVINGYVEIPNSKIQNKTKITTAAALAAISGSKRSRLTESGLRPRHNMKFVEMPTFDSYEGYPSDWFGTLNSI